MSRRRAGSRTIAGDIAVHKTPPISVNQTVASRRTRFTT